jgi:hypothetical membrane protein
VRSSADAPHAGRRVALWLRPPGWLALAEGNRRQVRVLAWTAIAAQAVFVLGWLLGWALEGGYSPVRDYISELGRDGARAPWTFEVSVVIWSAGFAALAVALAPALRGRPWSRLAPALFGIAGVLAILLVAFRLDCATTMSHTCKAMSNAGTLSWHNYAHDWTGVALEAGLWLTPFALARAAWPSRLARLLLLGGAAMGVVIGVVWATGVGEGPVAGLVQRLQLSVVHGWVIVWAAALIMEASPGWPPERLAAHASVVTAR